MRVIFLRFSLRICSRLARSLLITMHNAWQRDNTIILFVNWRYIDHIQWRILHYRAHNETIIDDVDCIRKIYSDWRQTVSLLIVNSSNGHWQLLCICTLYISNIVSNTLFECILNRIRRISVVLRGRIVSFFVQYIFRPGQRRSIAPHQIASMSLNSIAFEPARATCQANK